MSDTFNLVEQPWLPCRLPDGGRREYGLREALAQAHEIAALEDASPLITVALHRLLLAVLHRVVGPETAGEWSTLWSAGRIDMGRLDPYLHQWCGHFDLFDARHPFYQTASLGVEYAGPIAKLAHERASGNNATLFDHTTEASGRAFGPAEAARYLVAYHSFAVGGLVSYEKKEDKSATGAPLVKMAVGLAKGRTLFETLLLNLVRYSPRDEQPFAVRGADLPAWERDDATQPRDRLPHGYIDLLTWQSRRIRLFAEQRDGAPQVTRVVIMKGEQFTGTYSAHDHETMAAFVKLDKPSATQDPFPPVAFKVERAIWRDSLALLQLATHGAHRSRVLSWLAELQYYGYLEGLDRAPFDIYGLCSDRANILLWRHERLPLPLAYLRDKALLDGLGRALDLADAAARDLNRAVRWMATLLLAPKADQDGARKPLADDVSHLADSLGAARVYWAALDLRFAAFMVALPSDAVQRDGQTIYGEQELPRWIEAVRREARAAFAAASSGLDGSARSLKALSKGARLLDGLLAGTLGRTAGPSEGEAA